MTARFGLISNPLSHSVSQRGSHLETVAKRDADALFYSLDVFDDLPNIMKTLGEADVSGIFVEGGDGTAMAVLTALLSGRTGLPVDTPIALLPGGMTNTAAKAMGLQKAGQGGIRSIMAAIRAGDAGRHKAHMPLLEVSLSKHGQPLYGFFLSTGAVPHGIRYCRRALHTKGVEGSVAVGLTLARLVFGPRGPEGNEVMRPTDLTFESSAFHAAGSHLFTLATTLPQLNLGLDPFWGKQKEALRFTHATWPANGLLRAMLGIIAGGPEKLMRKRGMESFNIDEALLKYSGDLVLDGEFLTPPPSGKIKISTTEPLVFLR